MDAGVGTSVLVLAEATTLLASAFDRDVTDYFVDMLPHRRYRRRPRSRLSTVR